MIARSTAPRDALVGAFEDALVALDPTRLVAQALPPLPPKQARVVVVAAGKAASAMAAGARARWPDRIARVLIGDGGHPIPDDRSVASAEEALRQASALGPRDLLVVLISGGASAMFAAPPRGVTLADKQALVARLLDAGATIRDVNLVRRHFSRVKGGRLALAAGGARVLTLSMSDVVGGDPHDVGSGPSVPDPTTIADAREVLERAGIPSPAMLGESVKPGQLRARVRVLADPDTLAHALADALTRRGLHASATPADEGDARAVVARRLGQAAALAPGRALVVATEPTLALPAARGRGGRAGWVALAAMSELPEGVTLLCAASDGVDGSSGGRGAIVQRADAERSSPEAIRAALEAFDDATLHRALGTQLEGGPTGHNLTDVHVLARLR